MAAPVAVLRAVTGDLMLVHPLRPMPHNQGDGNPQTGGGLLSGAYAS